MDEAAEQLREVVEIAPERADPRHRLAIVLTWQGKMSEAIEQYRLALEADPEALAVRQELAWYLATYHDPSIRNASEALQLAEVLCDGPGKKVISNWDTLAAAYAENGKFREAVTAADKAIELALDSKLDDVALDIEYRRQLYRVGLAYRSDQVLSVGRESQPPPVETSLNPEPAPR